MAKDIIKNIPLTLDINARKRLDGTVDINLYSKDIATGQFEFTFIDEDENPVVLDETYSAQALVKYENDSKTYLDDMTIEGNIIRFIFPHDFITRDGLITMYIYITKDNYTSDVAAISFPVFVSEIDKDLDPSISVHYIGKIEQLIEDTKNEIDDRTNKLFNEIILNNDFDDIKDYHQQLVNFIEEFNIVNIDLNQAITDINATNETIKQAEEERKHDYSNKANYADIVNESERGKNLFDKTKTTDGYMINSADGKTHTEQAGWSYSEPIPVEGGRTIIRNKAGGVYQYDADDNKILGTGNGGGWDIPVLIDHNTKVIRLNVHTYNKDALQVEYGTVPTEYEPYREVKKTLASDIKVTPDNLEGIELGGDVENQSDGMGDKLYKVNSANNFTIFNKISANEFAGYNFSRTQAENYIRLWDLSIYRVSDEVVQTSENYENPSVPMKGAPTNNHYTTDIGSTVSKEFKGHKIELTTYVRHDGGIWSVDIDGVDYGIVSTWNENAFARTTVLADDLSNTDHTLTLTYLGEDPEHPATTSDGTPTTPRGWIKYHSGGAETYTFNIYSIDYNNKSLEKVDDLAIGYSNKDFAFHVRPMGQETPLEFFPQHSGVDTTMATAQTLSIDGEEVDITTVTSLTPFSTGAFNQVLTCKLPTDTEERASVKISFVFDESDRVEQFLEMKFNLDTNVYAGYVFMMPVNAQYIDKVTTNVRESVTSLDSDIGVSKYFENTDVDSYRVTMRNGMEDYYIDTSVFNRSHPYKAFWLQNRDMTMRKVYPTVFSGTDLVSGSVVYYDGYYKVGKMKGVNLMV